MGVEQDVPSRHQLSQLGLPKRSGKLPCLLSLKLARARLGIEETSGAERIAPPEHDDLHRYIALPFLRGFFAPAVLALIRMYVDAKRCPCTVDAGYWDTPSQASKGTAWRCKAGATPSKRSMPSCAHPFAKAAL